MCGLDYKCKQILCINNSKIPTVRSLFTFLKSSFHVLKDEICHRSSFCVPGRHHLQLYFNHIHKKRKDSLETRAVYIEIAWVSWNLPNGPKHRGSILKNMASSEGDQLLAGACHAIMGKIEAGIPQTAKKWNCKWILMYQGYFFRKIPAINGSFAPKYAHLASKV